MDLEQQPHSVPAAFESSSSAAASTLSSSSSSTAFVSASCSTPPIIGSSSSSSNSGAAAIGIGGTFSTTTPALSSATINQNNNSSSSSSLLTAAAAAANITSFDQPHIDKNTNVSNLNNTAAVINATQQQQQHQHRGISSSLSPSVLNNSSSSTAVNRVIHHQHGVRTPPPSFNTSAPSASVLVGLQSSAVALKDKIHHQSAGAGPQTVSRLSLSSSPSSFLPGLHQQVQSTAVNSQNLNSCAPSSPSNMGGGTVGSPRGVKRKSSLTNNANVVSEFGVMAANVGSPNSSSAAPPNKSAAFAVPTSNSNGSKMIAGPCSSPSYNLKASSMNQQMFDTQGVPNFDRPPSSSSNNSLPGNTYPSSNLHHVAANSPPVGVASGSAGAVMDPANSQSGIPNISTNGSNSGSGSVSSPMCCRVFSTSILHKAEHYLSRGLSHNLLSFHAGETNSLKFLPPATEDDKKKCEIKAEAQEKYCTSKTNTAIANMKALTDSIPTPRSWASGGHSSSGGGSGGGGAVSTVSAVIGATSLNSMLMDTPHGLPVGGPHSLPPSLGPHPPPTSISNSAVKQEADLSGSGSGGVALNGGAGSTNQGPGSASSATGTGGGSAAGANGGLSQDLLSKRARKTEYLKTLKKSLLEEEIHLNESKHGAQQGAASAMVMHQQAMHMNAAAAAAAMGHPQHRMMQHMVGAPGGPPPTPGMMSGAAGGNQTANAVALAAANRAAAMRQQDFLRQQQQQHHNHANCVQGMCMHQMPPPGHPARQMMAMAGPQPPGGMMGAPSSPYMPVSTAGPPPMAPMPSGVGPPGAMRLAPPGAAGPPPQGSPAAAAAAAHMMKCRPPVNANGVHNMLSPNGGGNVFMPPPTPHGAMGPAPSMYPNGPPPPNSSRANALIVPPNGVDTAGMMSAGPAQPLNPNSFSNPMQNPANLRMPPPPNSALPIRQMVPPFMHNMMPGGPGPDNGMNMPPSMQPNPYPPNNGPPMTGAPFQQRIPGPPPPNAPPNGNTGANGGGGNNSMINVIMTIGSGHGSTSNVATLNSQPPGVMSGAQSANLPPTSFAMQSNAQMMLDHNSGIPMKTEGGSTPGGLPGNQTSHPSFQNSGPSKQTMFPNQSAPNEPPMGAGAPAGMNSFNPGGPYHSNMSSDPSFSASDFYSNPMNPDANRPLIDQQSMHANSGSGAPFDLDELNNTSMMSGSSDQRQISVNVDKNMFMVQSNLNGAQFNVQGSALPQGSNLRTNVAVNMQVQSNRLAPMGNGNGAGMNQLSSVNKFSNSYDPAGQGPPPHVPGAHSMQGIPPSQQMWPPPEGVNFGAPPHSMSQRPPAAPPSSFDVYSNLSEFKPISDTPKGTVEYLPDGKTREKSKEHNDYPPPQPLPPHSNASAVSMGGMPGPGPPGGGPNMIAPPPHDFIATSQHAMMMAPHQMHYAGMHEGRGQPLYDPSSTFTDFNFTAM